MTQAETQTQDEIEQAAAPAATDGPAVAPAPDKRPTTRIEPVLGGDGKPVDLHPPGGSRWIRDADGGLTPADRSTAEAVGLAWLGA